MRDANKFLVMNGDCESGLFATLAEAEAEANENDASNCVIWEVTAKYEPGLKACPRLIVYILDAPNGRLVSFIFEIF